MAEMTEPMTKSDAKIIKRALYLLLNHQKDSEIAKVRYIQKEEYDGCGCSTMCRVEDKPAVEKVERKYKYILSDLKGAKR